MPRLLAVMLAFIFTISGNSKVFAQDQSPTPAPVQDQDTEKENHSSWGGTGSIILVPFDSLLMSRLANSIAGQTVCVKGRTWDLGVSYGKENSSYWRLTIGSKTFHKGSFTQYTCEKCGQDVKNLVVGSVNGTGFQAERVFRLEVRKDMPVQPMVTANAGVVHLSGSVTQLTGPVGSGPTKAEEVGTNELFGSKWFPFAGAGVGVMGTVSKRLTYGVTVVGFEYPGVYFAKVTVTYWPSK